MSSGYFRNDEETRAHFVDGWFRTRDLGIIPGPGKLNVIGRADDMLNIGGRKVAPYPLEERIRALEGVADAVLLSAPDEQGIEDLHVFVEPRENVTQEQIQPLLVPLLNRHTTTYAAYFLKQLPRTGTGKVATKRSAAIP